MATSLAAAAGAEPTRSAVAASAFVDTIGVNTHLSWVDTAYWDLDQVIRALDHLGIDNVRDVITHWSEERVDALIAHGVEFAFLVGTHELEPQLRAIEARAAHADYVEGPNEIDNWPVTFEGRTGLRGAADLMAHLREWIDGSPTLGDGAADVPLLQITFGHTSTTGLPIDLTPYADVANAHSYAPWGWNPSRVLDDRIAGAKAIAPGDRVVSTEAGYHTATQQSGWTGVSEAVQASYTLNLLFEQHARGVEKTYLYGLLDHAPDPTRTDPERNFGLFRADGTPRLVADAIGRVTAVLEEAGEFEAGSLAYAVSGLPATGDHLLLQTGSGRYVVAIWNDVMRWDEARGAQIDPARAPIELSFAEPVGAVTVHDPIEGTAASLEPDAAGALRLELPAHPLLIEVEVEEAAAAPPPATRPELTKHDGRTVSGTQAADRLEGTAGDDRLEGRGGHDLLRGSDGNDALHGGAGDDRLFGGRDDDLLFGGAGRDLLHGGPGRDAASFAATRQALRIDLDPTTGFAFKAGAGAGPTRDELRWIEGATGGLGNDIVIGSAAGNHLRGGPGGDRLEGRGGSDVLEGGAGADVFVINLLARGTTRILDFAPEDELVVRGASAPVELLPHDRGLQVAAPLGGVILYGVDTPEAVDLSVERAGDTLW